MISLDQVILLQKKVESAVQKIVQLKAENDALRRKCSELTNALSEKTELISSFHADENKIEEGILKALERLNSIENSVLNSTVPTATPDGETTESTVVTSKTEDIPESSAEDNTPLQNSEPENGQFDIF